VDVRFVNMTASSVRYDRPVAAVNTTAGAHATGSGSSGGGYGSGAGFSGGTGSGSPGSSAERQRDASIGQLLNPRYTFSTFVVGSNNRLPHAAALSVAERPGHSYNPLFVYGGSGLGKTHLMHAIGHAVIARHPKKRVAYATSEKFTNEFINSIRAQ